MTKPSPAMLVALLALFIALGGSSYAAIALSRNSVQSKHIANGQVKRLDLGKNAITSAQVEDLSLLAKDFKAGQLPAGPQGPTGPPGAAGVNGGPGPRGPSDAFGASFEPQTVSTAAGGPIGLAKLDLPAGSFVVFANAIVRNDSDKVRGIQCGLGFPGVQDGHVMDDTVDAAKVENLASGQNPEGAATATLNLIGVAELDAPDRVRLDCALFGLVGSGNITINDIDIGAVQVANMHIR